MLHFRIFLLTTFLIRTASVSSSKESCPSLCECKWKKGKETLSCPSENFSNFPRMEKHSGTQVLEFPGNPLRVLHDDVFIKNNFLNLQELYLSSCLIENIEPHAFRDLINLVRLDLSSNSLSSVPEKSLRSVTQLRELSLSGNPIRKIKNYAFSPLSQLVKLELSDCRLIWIEPYAFNGLETLRRLKIDGNRLTELNPAVWYPLRNSLYGIDLHSNPWNCSCALRPTLEWIRTANVPPSIPPICASPSRLRQKSWSSLRERDFACSPVIVLLASSRLNNVTLTCRIRGDPLVNITWSWEGSPLNLISEVVNASSPYFLKEDGASKSYVITSNLTILNKERERGTYRCSGKNAAGNVEESIRLTDAHSILGGTPVTTLRKRSSRDNLHFVLGSLTVGSLLFVCLFGACCVYGVHTRSPRALPEVTKTTYTNGGSSNINNGHGPKLQATSSDSMQQINSKNSMELTNMLKVNHSSNEPEGGGGPSNLMSPDIIQYKDGYEDTDKSVKQPTQQQSSSDCYVEIEPVMKSELLATARETEIRGVMNSVVAKKPYPQRAFLSYRSGLSENGEEDKLLGDSGPNSPHRSHTLDDNRLQRVPSSSSYSYPVDDPRRRLSITEEMGHPKIKTFLREYNTLQSQLNRLREARYETQGHSRLLNSSQNSSPDLRYNYSPSNQELYNSELCAKGVLFEEDEEYRN